METRLGHRISVNLKVISKIDKSSEQNIKLAGGNYFKADAYDISNVGIGIFTRDFLPKGLVMRLATDGVIFGLKGVMKIKGEVRHCNFVKTHKYKCGIKFLELPENYRSAISRFVSEHEKSKTTPLEFSDKKDLSRR